MSQCQICHRSITREIGVCEKCLNRVHSHLDDLFELWQKAHEELIPGKGRSGMSGSEKSIGVNVEALSFVTGDDILGKLHAWEVLIREGRNMTRPALLVKLKLADEIFDAIKFAQINLEWSSSQEWFNDFAVEVKDLHTLGIRAARIFDGDRTTTIKCPGHLDNGTPCGSPIRRHRDLLSIFACRTCGTEWTTLKLAHAGLAKDNSRPMLDSESIAALLGLSSRRIRQLVKEHNIKKIRTYYDVKHLIVALQESAKKKTG